MAQDLFQPSDVQLQAIEIAQALYKIADQTRVNFGGNAVAAIGYYAEFVNFISRVCPANADCGTKELLDVGCGCGWSSFCLSRVGYRTIGVDLNPLAFEPPAGLNLTLGQGNALALPFEADRFDLVVSYQCLEHIPDPETALLEMMRVCKPNGIVCIVGPNLLSPAMPIKILLRDIFKRSVLIKRRSSTSRHPYGNTVGEHLQKVFWTRDP